MVDDLVKRAEELRETARRLRRLGQDARSPDVRRDLLEVADRFEQRARDLAVGRRPDPET